MAQSAASLADVAAGRLAAERVYKLIQYPSSINAVEMDDDKKK